MLRYINCASVRNGFVLLCCSISCVGQTVSSLTTASAPVGVAVTISGSGFGASQSSGTVSFSGTPALVNSWNDTTIVARVPVGASTGTLVVTTAAQNTAQTSFTVNPAASLIDTDIGSVFAPGSSTYNNGAYSVTSSGRDVWFTADAV